VYLGLVELVPVHLLALLSAHELREAVLEGSWKPAVVTSFSVVD